MSFRLIAVRSGWVKFCLKHRAWRDWNSVESGPDAGRAGTGLFDLSYRRLSDFEVQLAPSSHVIPSCTALRALPPWWINNKLFNSEPNSWCQQAIDAGTITISVSEITVLLKRT